MKNKIASLTNDKAKDVLTDFCNVYFEKGFGLMNKTEIETLMYHVLRKNNLLTGKCFNDSCTLKIPESRARKLIYDSDIKYKQFNDAQRDRYLREEIGKRLQHADLVKSGTQIRFAIDDKYLQVALNAKLRENNILTDSSFNRDIVSLDEKSFIDMLILLVPNADIERVREHFNAFQREEAGGNVMKQFKDYYMAAGEIAGKTNALLALGKTLLTFAGA